MRMDDFEYELPAERIAQRPAEPRDASRLLVVDRAAGTWRDARFHALEKLLRPGDLLVCLGAGSISAWANALPERLNEGNHHEEPETV